MDGLRDKYIRACKYKPSLEQNFVLSHVNTSVGFIPTAHLKSQISVLDDDFNILFSYDVEAHIGACTISDDGRYIAWQTATSNTEDGDSVFLYDVKNKKLLFKITAKVHIKHIPNLFIEVNTYDLILFCHYNIGDIAYDIHGNIISSKMNRTEESVRKGLVNPYVLLNEAEEMIQSLNNDFNSETAKLAAKKIDTAIKSKKGVSEYQSSSLYKRLADICLSNDNKKQSLLFYKKGLEIYPKLPVKKIIKKLEDET